MRPALEMERMPQGLRGKGTTPGHPLMVSSTGNTETGFTSTERRLPQDGKSGCSSRERTFQRPVITLFDVGPEKVSPHAHRADAAMGAYRLGNADPVP